MLFSKKHPEIYFVHQSKTLNCGDLECCPFLYYYNYFRKFNTDVICIEDTNKLKKIHSNDIVIIGGGGLLDCSAVWNDNINLILEKSDNVIGWGFGFNAHYADHSKKPYINFDKFKLLSIRDFNHSTGLPYLPCVSLKNPLLNIEKPIVRDVGVINHFAYGIPSSFDSITNHSDICKIINFIAESEQIITSTYHSALWAMFMGKPVSVINKFSPKFDFFEYKPKFFNDIFEWVSQSKPVIPNAKSKLEIARMQNDIFFTKVYSVIENALI